MMKNTLISILSIISSIIAIILIIMLLIKITGHSPDSITILSWGIGLVLSLEILILSILFPIKENLGELNEFKRQTISEIRKLKDKITDLDASVKTKLKR